MSCLLSGMTNYFVLQGKSKYASHQRIVAQMPSARERLGAVSVKEIILVTVKSVNVSKLE